MGRKVTSREYKVMLPTSRFGVSETHLSEPAGRFWETFTAAVRPVVLDTDGTLDTVEKRRRIRFFDTPGRILRSNDYVFRERTDLESGAREVTLKFRHPDRYIAQARDMSGTHQDAKTKFEEDIKLGFLKLYSFSTKQPIDGAKRLNRLNDPGRLYPDLPGQIPDYDGDASIDVVGGFTAREVVLTGADVQIGEDPKVEAECALVAWYDDDGDPNQPVVVEFSFKYEDDDEDFAAAPAARAYEIITGLAERRGDLAMWVDREGPTKTTYVYRRAEP